MVGAGLIGGGSVVSGKREALDSAPCARPGGATGAGQGAGVAPRGLNGARGNCHASAGHGNRIRFQDMESGFVSSLPFACCTDFANSAGRVLIAISIIARPT